MTELTWYVLRASTRMELRAETGLREQGFQAYAPCRTRWVRHAGRKEPKRQALFEGYLFVGIDHATQSCRQVADTDGVCQILSVTGRNGEPVPIPQRWVTLILAAEIHGAFDETIRTNRRFTGQKGERAHIAGGQFIGYLAELLQDVGVGDKKVRVELLGLGGGKMKVDAEHLKAA
jgi:transcription antitermination factor NusG